MDFTVYLPDEIGVQAKQFERGVLSRLLRDAVQAELERRRAMAERRAATVEEFDLDLVDDNEEPYVGRLKGHMLIYRANKDEDVTVYLAEDDRVIAYDGKKRRHQLILDPVEELREWLPDQSDYVHVLRSIGETPVVDL